uniref:hypothetical protein n=1 Tax=Plantactinospora alkalitolerans TaxID=2789879 RepID=UPI002B203F57
MGLLPLAGRSQQLDALGSELPLERFGGEALVRDEQDAVVLGDHPGVGFQHRGQYLAFADLGVR